MRRRTFLSLAAAGFGTTTDVWRVAPPVAGQAAHRTNKETATSKRSTAMSASDAETIFVDPDGSDDNSGTEDAPYESIQTAIDQAQAGDTVFVRSGNYREEFITKRAGEPDNPITITGPPEAVIRPPRDKLDGRLFDIVHSHVHLTGLTFNGLAEPDNETDPNAYSSKIIECRATSSTDPDPEYLTDVKILPHAVGNARTSIINHIRVNELEVGRFELIGPAGVQYLHGDKNGHVGEVVSLGISADNITSSWYPWDEPDQSHDIHAHHIDNTAGYSHTELVEVHAGMYDVTIEYCIDLGGSGKYFLQDDLAAWTESAMALRGAQSTLRWCVIEDGHGAGLQVGNFPGLNEYLDFFDGIPDERFPGKHNSVYGNQFLNNESLALSFPGIQYDGAEFDNRPEDQKSICGNEYNGETLAQPASECPGSVPQRPPKPDESYANPPKDLDRDDKFEDLNGNGEFEIVDVQALFVNRDDGAVQNHSDAYDFNDDGRFSIADVQRVFTMFKDK